VTEYCQIKEKCVRRYERGDGWQTPSDKIVIRHFLYIITTQETPDDQGQEQHEPNRPDDSGGAENSIVLAGFSGGDHPDEPLQ
jgi:hypothetical protein